MLDKVTLSKVKDNTIIHRVILYIPSTPPDAVVQPSQVQLHSHIGQEILSGVELLSGLLLQPEGGGVVTGPIGSIGGTIV